MSVRERIALWRLERRLRKLQNAYYDGQKRDEAIVLDYFRTLEAARTLHLTASATEHLTRRLRESGFNVRRVHYNGSPVPELRYLDLRDFGLNLFLECVKP